ncbi:hypothetical protein RKE25_03290 [Dyella sp. BiH032]|uniref:hypothetical protein n=1 Tax=Dyella sp. BiH032 TaxID=3075430 RepID=UPI0028935254|nr:hypothetical protein [Dyella sp. BiH032]WNL46677.1 hypothetical protein RKE25_03290 [Dyella sp. BiH032]
MQTLKLSVSLPDATHPDMELRLSVPGADSDVVIALPTRGREAPAARSPDGTEPSAGADDEYALGGYAGI